MTTSGDFEGEDPEIRRAVELLRQGDVVGMPTETVYGLAGDGLNPRSVERIFAIKGRPSTHPVILHIGDLGDLERLCRRVPTAARKLAAAFWPGPLTMILRRSALVPDAVTGGLDTVGIRMPSHPTARRLIRAFGGPLAAPSANRFGRVSPTRRQHVVSDLGKDVALVLEGGPCEVGVESTIIDASAEVLRMLRHGSLSAEDILRATGLRIQADDGSGPRAPGTLASHYAPRARLLVAPVDQLWDWVWSEVGDLTPSHNALVGVLTQHQVPSNLPAAVAVRRVPPPVEDFARELYAALRELDALGCQVIVTHLPELSGVGEAVADRLRRASHSAGGGSL